MTSYQDMAGNTRQGGLLSVYPAFGFSHTSRHARLKKKKKRKQGRTGSSCSSSSLLLTRSSYFHSKQVHRLGCIIKDGVSAACSNMVMVVAKKEALTYTHNMQGHSTHGCMHAYSLTYSLTHTKH